MNEGRSDMGGLIFGALALLAGIVQYFTTPFAFAPLALLFLVIAIMLTPKYRTLYQIDVAVISVGVVVGGLVAVLTGNPLY